MNKEDKICAFCKYHFIEEISFDSPQSCCKKRKATTEKWLKCDDFEYSDRYIEALQQKLNQLETKINTYENPEDMTLMFMWCDEKAKDKIKELKQKVNQLETNRDEVIKEIKKRSTPEVAQLYIEILERGKE